MSVKINDEIKKEYLNCRKERFYSLPFFVKLHRLRLIRMESEKMYICLTEKCQ